jgi:hypothetical protein
MLANHIKINASAENLEQLKNALLLIISKLDGEEISTTFHDDFQFSYELFDSQTLNLFDVDPKEFIFVDLPNNL